jgi:FkbM family methyltransferase
MIKTIESITHDFGGDVFIDIGGNVGMWTMELVGLYNKIYFIEPSSIAIEQAKININGHCDYFQQPDLKYRVEYIKKICSSESGQKMSISTTTDDTGNFSVYANELYGSENIKLSESDIDTMRLDDLLFNIPDGSNVTIKVDTEGCDFDVLLSGVEIIKKFKPTVCVEFHWHMYYNEEKRTKLFDMFRDLGYKIIKFDFACYHHEAEKLFDHKHKGVDLQGLHFQMLMIPPGR